ncbi:MAG: protein BatD [Nitrospinae bacterium]|nr:protein BatD [Nitrospinota bacterium]
MRWLSLILALAAQLTMYGGAFAADINISAKASPERLPPGESFQLTIRVEGSGVKSLPDPVLPRLENFEITGKGVNQEISMVNLTAKVAKSVVYTIRAPKEGTFEIPSATVEYDGRKYSTKPINIVVDPKAQAQAQGAGRKDPLDLDGLINNSFFPQGRKIARDDIFITMDVDKKEAVPNEPVMATFSFYRAVDIYEHPTYMKPDFKGFWVEDMQGGDNKREWTSTQNVNGKAYHVTRLKYALMPVTTGTHTIEPAQVYITVDPWSDRMKLQTKPITVNVRPLPEKGRPAGFKGMVGSYTVTSGVEPSTPAVNSNVMLRISISGDGYLKPAPAPEKPVLDGFEIFEPKVTDTLDKSQGKLISRRIIEFPMIPRQTGEKTIPPMVFTWYDTAKKEYVRAATVEARINVTAQAGGQGTAGGHGGIEQVQSGMRYIKPDVAVLSAEPAPVHGRWWMWVILAAPLPALAGINVFARRRQRLLTDRRFARLTNAAGNAHKKLDEAEGLSDGREFFAHVDSAIRGYLADRWDMPAPSVTAETIHQRINADGALRDEIINALESAETGRYAPSGGEDRTGSLKRAREIIGRLERSK